MAGRYRKNTIIGRNAIGIPMQEEEMKERKKRRITNNKLMVEE